MPRGLGDDPLARKRDRRSKSTSTGDTVDRPATKQTTNPPATTIAVGQAVSHNDVFFRRRSEGTPPPTPQTLEHQQVSTVPDGVVETNKVPEIAEAIDIVRIAEATQSTRMMEAQETRQIATHATFPASSATGTDEPIAVVETRHQVVHEENVATADSAIESQATVEKQAEPEPRRKGFLNRLLRRFGG